MSRRLLLLFAFLLLAGNMVASPPLSPEAQRVQNAYARLQANPTAAPAKLAYLKAFPDSKAAFLRVFSPVDGGQLYGTSHEQVTALKSIATTYPQAVLALCFGIGKNLTWDADAVGDLQYTTVEVGGRHPRAFAAEARKLKPAERQALFRFLADAENHRQYPQYQALITRLTESGAADLAAALEQARQRRMKEPHG